MKNIGTALLLVVMAYNLIQELGVGITALITGIVSLIVWFIEHPAKPKDKDPRVSLKNYLKVWRVVLFTRGDYLDILEVSTAVGQYAHVVHDLLKRFSYLPVRKMYHKRELVLTTPLKSLERRFSYGVSVALDWIHTRWFGITLCWSAYYRRYHLNSSTNPCRDSCNCYSYNCGMYLPYLVNLHIR